MNLNTLPPGAAEKQAEIAAAKARLGAIHAQSRRILNTMSI